MPELTDAEQAWMIELDRIGAHERMYSFPMPSAVLHGRNCFLEEFRAGLSPREAIDKNR